MDITTLPTHPRTGLRAVGIVDGRPVWPILGGSGDGGDPPAGGNPGGQPPAPPAPPAPTPPAPQPPEPPAAGYPADTPVAEMTVAQQAAYWKAQARKHEGVVKKRQDYDQLKEDSAELAKLRKERETDTERATREAADKARTETLATVSRKLVMAEFRAAAAGRIDAERLATLTDDIDPARYLDAAGEVDTERITTKVAAWAPDGGKPPAPRQPKPDPSQGPRGGKARGTDAGREMFAARRRKPAGTSATP